MSRTLDRALNAIARGEAPPPDTDPADVAIIDAALRLAAVARSIEPSAGAFSRAVAAATLPAPARPWPVRLLRPVLAIALSVVLAAGLGTASYASTPGEPLYPAQRRLDDLYLGLPRSPADATRAYGAAADRRVAQAAAVATRVAPEVLRGVLDDAARYLRDARASLQRSPESERRWLLQSLLETQRSAKDRLAGARENATGEQRGQIGQFEEGIQHDIDDEEHELQQEGESGRGGPAKQPTDGTSGQGGVGSRTSEADQNGGGKSDGGEKTDGGGQGGGVDGGSTGH
ncbi:MAG TPA: hypothetical protein VGS17_10210 [Candidatus Limnocylindria bacterium]|nr:hypothetical protein [Candidatus Limnocylindria bacterium]